MILYIFLIVGLVGAQCTAITVEGGKGGEVTFWFNSSDTRVAAFAFHPCKILACPESRTFHGEGYICVTKGSWGEDCSSWGAAAWNTGTPWGYTPQPAYDSKDKEGEPLLTRLTLIKPDPAKMTLVLNIRNPSPTDTGKYVLGWYGGGAGLGHFYLGDMYNNSRWSQPVADEGRGLSPNLVKPKVRTPEGMKTIADPTFADTIATETGFSGINLWLEWMRYSAHKNNRTNCYVCGSARPHLGTVPLNIPENAEECFLSLFTGVPTNHSVCEQWKAEYPISTGSPRPEEAITIYPGNYTCYVRYTGEGRDLGNFTEGYCASYSQVPSDLVQNQRYSLGDVYWICGDMRIRTRLEGQRRGECALAKVIMPLHILTDRAALDIHARPGTGKRRKRDAGSPLGSLDPHVYIDAIGVPRGVPDEFKARDPVKAGFESLLPFVTVNKNVDWINYIYYNQQRFVNYTREAFKGIAEQLEFNSQMTFENRMTLDMMLAERGGVCKMLEKMTDSCCTYIPDNTGPNGKVTVAIKKLEQLSDELKRNSGVTDPWDQYFCWLSGWQKALAQVGVTVLIILILFALIVCCVLPCVKKFMEKVVEQGTPTFVHQDAMYEEFPERTHTPLTSFPLVQEDSAL